MAAFQQLERSVVKCLDAHADAVERQFGEHLQVFRTEVIRIGFKCYFMAILHPINPADGVEYFPEILFVELRRSTSTKVERLNRLSFQVSISHFQLFAECFDVASFPFASRR